MMLLLAAGFIVLAGLVTLSGISTHLFVMQLAWTGIGLAVIAVLRLWDWSGILRSRWFLWGVYGLSVGLLVVTYLSAPVIRNTRSWIVIGPVEVSRWSSQRSPSYSYSQAISAAGTWP